MKKTIRSLVCLFCALLFILLCACQPAAVTPDEPESEPESSIESVPESSKEESRPLYEIAREYRADVETVAAEYKGKLSDQTIAELTKAFQQSLTEEEYAAYDEDPEKYLNERVRFGFDYYLNFRSYGSLTAPVAPEDFEKACELIREEFNDLIKDEEDRAVSEGILAQMEYQIGGGQDQTPYSESPQLHFDVTRDLLWGQFTDWDIPHVGYPAQ